MVEGYLPKIDYGVVKFIKRGSMKVKTVLKHVNEFLFILSVLTVRFRQNLMVVVANIYELREN